MVVEPTSSSEHEREGPIADPAPRAVPKRSDPVTARQKAQQLFVKTHAQSPRILSFFLVTVVERILFCSVRKIQLAFPCHAMMF